MCLRLRKLFERWRQPYEASFKIGWNERDGGPGDSATCCEGKKSQGKEKFIQKSFGRANLGPDLHQSFDEDAGFV